MLLHQDVIRLDLPGSYTYTGHIHNSMSDLRISVICDYLVTHRMLGDRHFKDALIVIHGSRPGNKRVELQSVK